jgi:hypothetical protein
MKIKKMGFQGGRIVEIQKMKVSIKSLQHLGFQGGRPTKY